MIRRKFIISFLTMLVYTLSVPALAKDLNLSVVLSKLEVIHTLEKRGDDLYMSITEYSSKAAPVNYLVPEYPTHWLSKKLNEVKNVTLWANTLKEGEGAAVIFSLIEQNTPPWHLDDLIGTVKLKVRNDKGNLKKEWVLPHQKGHQVSQGQKNEFVLKTEQAEYHIHLELKQQTGEVNFIKQRDELIRPSPFTGL